MQRTLRAFLVLVVLSLLASCTAPKWQVAAAADSEPAPMGVFRPWVFRINTQTGVVEALHHNVDNPEWKKVVK